MLTRTYFPNDGPVYSLVEEIRWDCPKEKLGEVVALIEGAFKAAPEDKIGAALFKLRMLTRGREQRSEQDQEAEAIIWIEQLRCWPGDIVLDVLRSWPSRPNGQWWPTWHEVESELRNRCDRRQALLNFVRRLAERPDPKPALTYEEPDAEMRAKAVERWTEMRASFVEPEATKGPKETPEQALARLAVDTTPVLVGEGLSKKLEEMRR